MLRRRIPHDDPAKESHNCADGAENKKYETPAEDLQDATAENVSGYNAQRESRYIQSRCRRLLPAEHPVINGRMDRREQGSFCQSKADPDGHQV